LAWWNGTISIGGASLVLTIVGSRRVILLQRVRQRLSALPAAPGLSIDVDIAVAVPIRSEPEQGALGVTWWMTATGSDPCFVTTASEHPPITEDAVIKAGGRVFRSQGSGKSSQINEYASVVTTEWVALFDSDSRPIGILSGHSSAVCVTAPSIYTTRFGPAKAWFFEGLAAQQTAWSLGFEADMPIRRRLAYVVGHGIIVRRRHLILPQALAEDLALGYSLTNSGLLIQPTSTYCDRSLFYSDRHAYASGVGRWFCGDLEALNRLPRNTLTCLRSIELFATWLFGPPSAALAVAVLWSARPAAGLLAFVAVALVELAPALLAEHGTRSLRNATPTIGQYLVLVAGALLRPLLDSIVISIEGTRRLFRRPVISTGYFGWIPDHKPAK
jgi:hypothetical protein